MAFMELFMAGFASYAGPCLFYCAPLVFPYIAASREDTRGRMKAIIIFSFSRFCMHALLGLCAALFGRALVVFFSGYSRVFFAAFGMAVTVLGILVLFGKKHLWSMPLPGRLSSTGSGAVNNGDLALLGVLMAIFPCAPRLAVLAYVAMEAGTPLKGILYSSAFGLGEMLSPVLLFGVAVNLIPYFTRGRLKVFFNALCGLLIIVLGLSLICRGFR
jgi:hypothetical protein